MGRRRSTAGYGPIIVVAGIAGFLSPFLVHAMGVGGTAWRWPAAVAVGVLLAGAMWLILRWRDAAHRERHRDASGTAPSSRSRS